MSRYYFDTSDGALQYHDTEGVDLADDAAARRSAAAALADLARDTAPRADAMSVSVHVRGADGRTVAVGFLSFQISALQ